ncbi:hypothetical protein FSP39_009828 [Pinctada imbricata]|uniref:TIR domain-containing protein n=1 Tax=Pinctada imbricata TaxID=66713 RepID=A0AA88XQZ3_PINIB|nr:hypothetical protein FSP39_009828 [Pinctada imbricata]
MITYTSSSTLVFENETLPMETESFPFGELPIEWKEHCLIQNLNGSNTTFLNCTVRSGVTLDVRTLRNLSEGVVINLKISMKCQEDGNLFLPMPVKVPSIVSLSVDNCNLLGTNSETFEKDTAKFSDKIRYFELTNSVRIIDDSYLKMMLQDLNSTDSTKCGHLNAEVLIKRNVTKKFKTSASMNFLFSRNLAKLARSYTVSKNVCIYKNLKLYDNSRNPALGMNPVGSLLQSSSYPVLQVMNLSRVHLNEIPHQLRKWRLYFPRLNYLDLSFNNLSEVNSVVEIGRSEDNDTLGVIDLRNNKIKLLTKENLESYMRHKFVKVDIRDNPFVCDCRMNTVKEFLLGNGHKLPKQYDYLYGLRCTAPSNLKGRRIMKLSADEFGCEKSSRRLEMNTIIILSALSAVIIIITIVVVVFRNEIPVLIFTRIYIHITCGSLKIKDDKSYDAFVAFSEENEDWVIRTLIPRLEHPDKPPSFEVCIHQRDFLLGAAIVDNIFTCVKNSRHSIFIISKAFLKSEWCLMEFRAALQQSLKDKTHNLIMVLYEDISDTEIDEDLRRYLKAVTYVKIEDRFFWDKVVYALSRRQKKSNARFSKLKR